MNHSIHLCFLALAASTFTAFAEAKKPDIVVILAALLLAPQAALPAA